MPGERRLHVREVLFTLKSNNSEVEEVGRQELRGAGSIHATLSSRLYTRHLTVSL